MKKEVYEDLRMVVIYTPHENGCSVGFKCYEIIYESEGKNYFEKIDSNGSVDKTEDIDKAQTFINGFVKWDGCSHYYFGDEGYLHLCGKHCISKVGEITRKIYNRCGELMPEHADDREFPLDPPLPK